MVTSNSKSSDWRSVWLVDDLLGDLLDDLFAFRIEQLDSLLNAKRAISNASVEERLGLVHGQNGQNVDQDFEFAKHLRRWLN